MKQLIYTAVVTLFTASAAQAQQAVQWKVSDGGNGHWYKLHSVPSQWILARQVALSQDGDLCSIETETERRQIASSMPCVLAYVGGYQLSGATTPSDRWTWLTGVPVSLPLDCDDNPCIAGTAEEDGEQDYLHSAGCWTVFGDVNVVAYGDCSVPDWGLGLFEWSADCNGDGIVDYGQCHDGTLPDYNGNNMPDCCERGEACVVGNYPAQWRPDESGNGHWYEATNVGSFITWSDAQLRCNARGGALASLGTQQEDDWVFRLIASDVRCWAYNGPYVVGPWIGARGASGYWRWDDGTAWSFAAWFSGEGPPSPDPREQFAHFFAGTGPLTPTNAWGDYFDVPVAPSYLTEWSADCNRDGIVDYGQILQGQLGDTNTDGIPDICQQPTCRDADLFRDFNVNGADLGILLSQWGPNTSLTVSDINKDGVVNGADLGLLLSFWGACP